MVIIGTFCHPTVHQRPLITNCCSLGAATTCLLRGRSKVFLIYELCRPVQLSDDPLKGLILAKGKISNISINIKKEIKDGLTMTNSSHSAYSLGSQNWIGSCFWNIKDISFVKVVQLLCPLFVVYYTFLIHDFTEYSNLTGATSGAEVHFHFCVCESCLAQSLVFCLMLVNLCWSFD